MNGALRDDGGPIGQMNMRDEVYRRLRRGIITQQYAPGFRFDLNELEARLGVSRTPIKEALQRLQSEALVEIRPRRGTFVVTLSRRDVEDTWEMRHVLERYAAERVVHSATDEDIARLQRYIDELEPLYLSQDLTAVIEEIILLDHDFHSHFVEIARNGRLSEMYDMIGHFVQLVRVQMVFHREDLALSRAEHHTIMVALHARDAAALSAAVEEHIARSIQRLFSRYPAPDAT